jgi:hypothetical protein
MLMDALGDRHPKEIKTKYPVSDSGPSEAYWAVKKLLATMKTVADMLPFVTNRYPSIRIRDTDYAKALAVEAKIIQPFIDERFSKPWMEWWLIALDAKAHGHNAAASKRAVEVRMPNGKLRRIKLTPEYIRDRLHVADEVAKEFVKYIFAYAEFLEVWNCIVNNDRVVREEFLRRLGENRRTIGLDNNNGSDEADNNISSYEYEYHFIFHYDRELYKQDKKTQGKVKCGPFTESEIWSFF